MSSRRCIVNAGCWIALVATLAGSQAGASEVPGDPECIVPARPRGGYDLSCNLVRQGLERTRQLDTPVRVTYAPGAIGAVAYNAAITQRADDGGAIVAFSSGTLLNIAQGKFGRYDASAVRWLAAVGLDYGMIAVRADSPHRTLKELIADLKKKPASVVLGAGGSVGSQDWMKAALIARHAGVNPAALRYVSFEGGGEALSALLGGQLHAVCGDISEVIGSLQAGRIRVLAVFAERRLPGRLAALSTAKEQGYDISWPVIRGFYMGPKVSDEALAWWRQRLEAMLAAPEFDELRRQHNLLPLNLTGAELEAFVRRQVAQYEALSREAGLIR
jgi:putative tricarboxylic transport membrane protein